MAIYLTSGNMQKQIFIHNFWTTYGNFIKFNSDVWDPKPNRMQPVWLKSVQPVLRKLGKNFGNIHTHTHTYTHTYTHTDICSVFDSESKGIHEGRSTSFL